MPLSCALKSHDERARRSRGRWGCRAGASSDTLLRGKMSFFLPDLRLCVKESVTSSDNVPLCLEDRDHGRGSPDTYTGSSPSVRQSPSLLHYLSQEHTSSELSSSCDAVAHAHTCIICKVVRVTKYGPKLRFQRVESCDVTMVFQNEWTKGNSRLSHREVLSALVTSMHQWEPTLGGWAAQE